MANAHNTAADVHTEFTQSLRKLGLLEADEEPAYTALTGGVSSDIWRVDLRRGPVCVKRALPALRVAMEWRAPVDRNRYEVAWFETVGGIFPQAVPKVLGVDRAQGLFVMEYLAPEHHVLWRARLFEGHADPGFAAEVGRVLVGIHSATAGWPQMREQFPTDEIFHAIRLEPYLEATARRHPDLAPQLIALAKTTATTKRALVHGDVSPKNILIGSAGPVFLDAECAWYGDPAFDLSFCLNHFLLKCLWSRAAAAQYLAGFDAMTAAYLHGVTWEPPAELEARAAALLPGLFLARVDGKSPVDYITRENDKDSVRRVARALIQVPQPRLMAVRVAWAEELRRAA